MAAVPRHAGKRGGLSMKNGEEGCASPTLVAADYEVAARGANSMSATLGGNHMPKIPDATDEIEVLHTVMRNLKEL
jgi:hypothetical protein